ncbi:restriction endonuclease subunit S [Streptomyces sp. JH34]|uniref:restriction endonuclease subunit S n=1 Tax=Streptomyces sp. JH34 TaxID=2793633 RepID=UPI0023F8F1FA|nr:restriction endonuclease subunit S [Streptomyces sp. JH34]MDF6017686.1 restriction endonuclease subunit S [Streptomyces sp. JH34]
MLRSTEIDLKGWLDPRNPAVRSLPWRDASRTRLLVGDLLVVRSSGSDAHLGKTGYVDRGASGMHFSNFLQRLRFPPTHSSRFSWYFLNSTDAKQQIRKLSSTTTGLQNLSAALIGELEIPSYPLDEQRRIADFLDAETGRIDSLSHARNRQLVVLRERTNSLILNTVRGQTEPGLRKPSGINWLGNIPADWSIMPVSYQFEVLLGKMLNPERAGGTHPAPYLRNTNVQWDRITTDDLLEMSFPPEEHYRYALHPGDLLVCEGGEPGRAAIWDGRMDKIYYQKALHRIRARGYTSPRWLFYCLRAATAQNVFAIEGNNTTISHLTGEQLRGYRFPFPEQEVQDRLVRSLDSHSHHQEELVQALHSQLTLLAERRQALITAAVTGQFDVSTASGRNVRDGVQA